MLPPMFLLLQSTFNPWLLWCHSVEQILTYGLGSQTFKNLRMQAFQGGASRMYKNNIVELSYRYRGAPPITIHNCVKIQ